MDINMPDMDGIAATERLSSEVPDAAVVMMSVQGEADYLRRSMLAGAREFLVKPFSSDELTASIRQVYAREQEKASRRAATPVMAPGAAGPGDAEGGRGGDRDGQVVAIFSAEGRRRPDDDRREHGDRGRDRARASRSSSSMRSFQFGDVGVLLNLNPKNKSIADLVPELEAGEPESLDTFVINHSAGVRVLLAPPSPEMAELITPTAVKRVIEALRRQHDLVIVDCTSWFNETTLAILDAADIGTDDAEPRDHEHQEHAPLPGGRRAARLRARQGQARPQSGGLRASASG